VSQSLAVSVITPTLGRPTALGRALDSLFLQTDVDFSTIEVVVVDNDPAGSAECVVAERVRRAPCLLRYVTAPVPGVANARNAGVAATTASLIAFLDDDQAAAPGWLAALIATQARLDADVVFGPIEGVVDGAAGPIKAYLSHFFSRSGPDREVLIEGYFGCGDSLVRRAALPDPWRPFSPERNAIGGEDDLLFGRMKAAGARFGWSPAALVQEIAPATRSRLSYVLRRAFSYGQGPASAAAAAVPPRPVETLGWMVQGAVQAPVFALVAGAKALMGRADWVYALDRAARGLGKLLWFPPFKIRFYGAAALNAGGQG
jgi:succinoglycan biosynthesis protein ExoM